MLKKITWKQILRAVEEQERGKPLEEIMRANRKKEETYEGIHPAYVQYYGAQVQRPKAVAA